MTKIAIIAPDGNRAIGLSGDHPADELATRFANGDWSITSKDVLTSIHSWWLEFDQIVVCVDGQWTYLKPTDVTEDLLSPFSSED